MSIPNGFDLSSLPAGVRVAAATPGDARGVALTKEEWSSLDSSAVDRRRSDFHLGRVAAHRALEALGFPGSEVLRGSSGEPLWPEKVVGSITHSANLALAMVGHRSITSGIGVDLEHRRAVDEVEDLVAFDAERDWLARAGRRARADRLLELFAAKEATFKAMYPIVRRYFGFEAVRLTRADPRGFSIAFVDDDLVLLGCQGSRVEIRWDEGRVLSWLVLPPDVQD